MTVLDPEIQEDVSPDEPLPIETPESLKKRHLDFEREALPHMDALYNFALRLTTDADEADDLLQETYLKAYRFFDMLNPITHATDEAAAQTYRVEPYVVAADVYSTGGKAGRGGWTWYTGSAGWLFRAGVEGILGIRREGGRLVVSPAIPAEWRGYSATLRLDGKSVQLVVRRGNGGITIDGRAAESIAIDKLRAGSVVTVETAR